MISKYIIFSLQNFKQVKIKHIFFFTFTGVSHNTSMKYDLMLGKPKEFYHEVHRTSHFLKFSTIEEAENIGADQENLFA